MKNIILKIAAMTFLGAVLPLSACSMGGTDMKAKALDENVEIVQDTEDCPDNCPAPKDDDCPDCKDGKGKKCPEDKENKESKDGDDEMPRFKPPHRGGKRGKWHGRIVRPIPEPIEGQPK